MANPDSLKPFKKGYDPRRWMKGRGKKSPAQKEGEQILLAVIWDELSREFDPSTGKAVDKDETLDALRLMVRKWIKTKPEQIADRVAGKVIDRKDITSKDESINPYMNMPKAELLALLKKAVKDES